MSAEETKIAYMESLGTLTWNSRPIITSLSSLAKDYSQNKITAKVVVDCIEERLRTADPNILLPTLYLMDSIVKNHPIPYKDMFARSLVSNFVNSFGKVTDSKVRMAMYKLRSTWNDVFEVRHLDLIDRRINAEFDPKWPIIRLEQQTSSSNSNRIILNPNFVRPPSGTPSSSSSKVDEEMERKREELKKKEAELIELKKQQVELEVQELRKKLGKTKATEDNKDKDVKKEKNATISSADSSVITSSNSSVSTISSSNSSISSISSIHSPAKRNIQQKVCTPIKIKILDTSRSAVYVC